MTQTPPPSPNPPELTSRVARGAAWIFAGGMFARLLGAANTIVVARLLVPADIGLVAVAVLAVQLLQGFSDIGVSQAVVKFRDADRDDLDTLFTLSVLRGLAVALLLVASAPLVATFYNDPRMAGVFLGVAAAPVISGLINPRFFEFERDLQFSREFILTVLNKFIGVIVSVTIAIIFRSYWAIILGMLAGGLVQLFLSYFMRPFLPRFSFKSIKKVFGFSGWLTGVSFVAALNNKLDTPILARFMGTGSAGIYFMGSQLSDMIAGQLAQPLSRAIYPGLATMQGEAVRMRRAFLHGVAALGAIAMPAAFGFAFVAEDATALLLGDQWARAVPVIQYIAPVAGLQSLFYATQSYAMALGLTRLVFIRELIYFLIRLPIFIWAVIAYGFEGAILAAAGLGLLHVALNLALYARVSGGWFWEPLVAARRSLFATMAMAIWFLVLRPGIAPIEHLSLIPRLIADIVSGAAVYGAALMGLWGAEGRPSGVERNLWQAVHSLRKRLTGV